MAGLRGVIRSAELPAGLTAHTAGTVATRVDGNATSAKTGGQVQWFSIIFVIALLVAVFRSALAPLIAVLPAVVVVLVAERLTAERRRPRAAGVSDRVAAADRARAGRGHGLRAVLDVPGA